MAKEMIFKEGGENSYVGECSRTAPVVSVAILAQVAQIARMSFPRLKVSD